MLLLALLIGFGLFSVAALTAYLLDHPDAGGVLSGIAFIFLVLTVFVAL